MKKLLVSLSLGLGVLAATPAFAGSFLIFNAGPANTTNFSVNVANNDGFDLTKITFDLTNTEAAAAGTQTLVFGGSFGLVPPPGGTAVGFGVQDSLTFGFNFTSFNTGEDFDFSWDPDILGNASYGAILSEAVGTIVTLVTTGGTVSGVLALDRTGNLVAEIASPVPEPTSLALVVVALCGLGVARRARA